MFCFVLFLFFVDFLLVLSSCLLSLGCFCICTRVHSDGRSSCLVSLVWSCLIWLLYHIVYTPPFFASLAFRLCCLVLSCLFLWVVLVGCVLIRCDVMRRGKGRGGGFLGKSFIHSFIHRLCCIYLCIISTCLCSHHFNRPVSASPLSLACL